MATKHVISRFSLLTDEFIDACQKEFRTGVHLHLEEEDDAQFPAELRAIIARESIDADRLSKAGPEILVERELDTFGDWMLVCLSEFLQAILEDAEEGGGIDPEILHAADRRSVEALFLAANSETASPIVNYEALNGFLAASLVEKGKAEGIDHLLRSVRFQLSLNEADGADFDGVDLVTAWNRLGEFDRADSFLARLLEWRPDDNQLYELAGFYLKEEGRNQAALAVTRRGLELVESTDDPDDQAQALKVAVEELEKAVEETPGQAPSDDLLKALETPFDKGTDLTPEAFCEKYLPEMADQPTKRPLTAEDVDKYQELEVPETFRRHAPKVGRNDPCPCGSGKKYKKCCGK